jgi:cGMP-dependent protein kinase
MQEKRLMLSIDHPFIVKLVKTIKNENYYFFLMEYVNGCTFDDYLNKKKGRRNITETKFFAAIMLTMVDYLNDKKIAHRDIKPSNIMVNSNGYLKLIDFGTATNIEDFTQTIIGTPHYIAPEVLFGKGYAFSCDYWSIGICLYEIFYGYYPFGNNSTDIMDVYKSIMHK